MAAEKNIENRIRRNFAKLSHSVLYKNFDNGFTVAGRPDLSGIYHGVPIAIEVKRGKDGNFKDNQLAHLKKWAQAGGISVLTCLGDLNSYFTKLDQFRKQIITLDDLNAYENAHAVWKALCPLMIVIDYDYQSAIEARLFNHH